MQKSDNVTLSGLLFKLMIATTVM